MRKLSMEELGRLSPLEMQEREKLPVSLVLDNVRSALNVGSVFRTADAFALEKIYLGGITAVPPHREILKTALGAQDTVRWEYDSDTCDALARLRREGYKILAVEQTTQAVSLQEFSISPGLRYALIFGNEVNGVSESALALADGSIEIPQFGAKHSLNIAVAVGIVSWHLVSQFLKSG